MHKILIVEDWWADRIHFEYLLRPLGAEVDFAWNAGRPGGVWSPEQIRDCACEYDHVLVDLAWTTEEEALFAKLRRESFVALKNQTEQLNSLGGFRLFRCMTASGNHRQLLSRCVIVSAYAYDPVRDFCKKEWGITRSFRKWEGERELAVRLASSSLRRGDVT